MSEDFRKKPTDLNLAAVEMAKYVRSSVMHDEMHPPTEDQSGRTIDIPVESYHDFVALVNRCKKVLGDS